MSTTIDSTIMLLCQAYDIRAAASSAVATNAAATSAYALAVEKLVAGRIDADTAGERMLVECQLYPTPPRACCKSKMSRMLPWAVSIGAKV